MNNRERFNRVMHFESVDRVPNVEIGYWDELDTVWRAQGLPADIPFYPAAEDRQYARHSRELTEYFGLDAHNITFQVSISQQEYPRPTADVVAEEADALVVRYSNGHLAREQRTNRGISQELEWPVKTRGDWALAQKWFVAGWHNCSLDRQALASIRNRDYPASLWFFGFWAQLRRMMGFERACTALHDDPGLIKEIVDFWAEYLLVHLRMVMEVFTPDLITIHEDMAYNHGPMLSPQAAEEFLLPGYAKVASFVNSYGVDIICVDSDGFPDALIPVLNAGGVNSWSPFEMVCREGRDDLLALGMRYPWLRMFGGMDKMALTRGRKEIDETVALIPPLVERGGFVPMIDHKVQAGVPLAAYQYYLAEKTKRLGSRDG